MKYFQQLPSVEYKDLENNDATSKLLMTNILTRASFLKEIMDNTAVYYDYQIKENETPEMIADKLYGDPDRHWIVLMFNQIMDPFYSFPLSGIQLDDYITAKYEQTLAESQTTTHHYEQRISRSIFLNDVLQETNEYVVSLSPLQLNFHTGMLEETPYLPGTADTYLDAGNSTTETYTNGITITTDRKNYAVSNYSFEQEENEKRRNIKLLDSSFVVTVENEFRSKMKNNDNSV
jgi:Base plate wedge protein 53